ncbi:16S rRNA (uracil(1498)-N(3))-methyltransferase [Pseudomonadota bacterium]
MRIPRIYTPSPLSSGNTVELDDNAFNHSVRVLRLKQGAPVVLFNGEGGEFSAELSDVQKKRAFATVDQHIDRESESPLHITLGQCISRGEKMDYTIQKAVELGVNRIIPLFSERCGVKLKQDRLDKKVEHWRGVVISACEQSGRNRIPEVGQPQTLDNWLQTNEASLKLVLAPTSDQSLRTLSAPENHLSLLIGPEGG